MPGAAKIGQTRRPDGVVPDLCPWTRVNVGLVQFRASVACALRSRERRFESYWGRPPIMTRQDTV